MTGRFEGKVVFVTGAARGQGRNHAIRFAKEGADVIAVDVCEAVDTVQYDGATKADLDQTVAAVEALDRRIVASVVDIRDLGGLTAAVDDGVAKLGRVDVVLSNAGIATFAPAAEMDQNTWSTMIDINLSGQFYTAKAAIPHLISQGDGGSIIFTSSSAGLKGMQNIAHYSAAKHGLIGLARSLANELAQYSIRVNTVHPGNVDTMMIQNTATRSVFGGGSDISREEFAAAATGMSMLPIPWVDVDDISNAMLYLASDEGRYLTGVALPVDAGTTQK